MDVRGITHGWVYRVAGALFFLLFVFQRVFPSLGIHDGWWELAGFLAGLALLLGF